MKNFKIWSLMALVVAFVACEPVDDGGNNGGGGNISEEGLIGEWQLKTWNNEDSPVDIYLGLKKDGSFELYQRSYTVFYELYTGSFSVSNGVLSGVYSDGEAWGSTYSFALTSEDKILTLTSNSKPAVESVYERSEIPAVVREEAELTRAVESEPIL